MVKEICCRQVMYSTLLNKIISVSLICLLSFGLYRLSDFRTNTYLYTMNFSSKLLEDAVAEFAKLPGIGQKTALRLVLHLLNQDKGDVERFSAAISKLRNEIQFCQV